MRRVGGTLVFAGFIACTGLREAAPSAPAVDDGGAALPNDDAGTTGPRDARASDADAEPPPCPAPCLPERILDMDNLGPLAVDSFNLYFGSANTGVFKCEKSDCRTPPVKMGDGKATRLAVAGGRVFWGEGDHLVACATGGCGGIPQGLATGQVGIDEVTTDGTTLVWHVHVGTSDAIRACPAATCGQGNVKEVTEALAPRAGFGVGDGKVFWTDLQTKVRFCPLPPVPCIEPGTLGPGSTDVVVFGAAVYWVHEQNVVSCPLEGCDGVPEKIGTSASPHLIAVDERDLYWRDLTEDKVLRCPIAGCPGEPEVIATNVSGVFYGGLALDADYVYWTAKDGLFRRHK